MASLQPPKVTRYLPRATWSAWPGVPGFATAKRTSDGIVARAAHGIILDVFIVLSDSRSGFQGHRHAGLIHSMPFLAAAAIIRFTNSSVISGGDAENSAIGSSQRLLSLLQLPLDYSKRRDLLQQPGIGRSESQSRCLRSLERALAEQPWNSIGSA